jgi:ribosomal protein S18 acetylase RimI-like enzyme
MSCPSNCNVARLGDPPRVTLRPRRPADEPFLRRLYHSVRRDEVVAAGFTPDFARTFLDDQFRLQTAHFDRAYGAGTGFALVMCRGSAIGRLYLHETDGNIHVADISLLPEWRGRGIGAVLLRDVLERAAAAGKGVSLSVDKRNRAQGLYRRLGFVQVEDTGADLLLRWRAPERSR